MTTAPPAELIDLERHPIADPDSPEALALARRCREMLDRTGACELQDFLRPAALARMARDTEALVPLAHHHSGKATPYLELPDPAWPEEHPRRCWNPYSLSAIAFDDIPAESDLARLYAWDGLKTFLARCLDVPELHRYADPLGACSVNVMREGDEVEWHFDQTDFVASVSLTDSERGGDFFYVPLIRSLGDENYPGVKRVLDGERADVVQIPMRPGTLLLFEGRHSIHCVSPAEGPTPRLVALLAYDTKPGTCASELLQKARYGRAKRPLGEAPAA